jgi:glycosyltransferase involved in cell wall biosynthesis
MGGVHGLHDPWEARMEAVSYARVQVSLVHEWLTNRAGSEQVVGALRRTFPGSSVSTTVFNRSEFPDWEPVHTSVLQRLAHGPTAHERLLPLLPAAWRTVEVPDAELVVSSFHSFSLRARRPPGVPHVVYCHTPPRFLYEADQLADERRAAGPALRVAKALLGPGDRRAARPPATWVANSTEVQDRIRRTYGFDSQVVHPPVEVERFASALGEPVGDHHLVFGRLVPYKRADLAVAAFAELGTPLVVAGTGRQTEELQASAPPNVRFVGRVDDEQLPALLAGARSLVFPGVEDFGITPVEAMAAGTPVVAFGRGGVLDTVTDGETGVLFAEQTVESLVAAVRRAEAEPWDRAAISASTQRFAEDRFAREMTAIARDVAG